MLSRDQVKTLIPYVLIFWVALGASVALRSSSLVQTPGRDGGIYAYIGTRLAEGEVLYRDVWDHKTPLIHYYNAALFKVFGPSFRVIAIAEAIWLSFAAVVMYAIARNIFTSHFIAWCVSIVFIIYAISLKIIEYHGMTETYAMLPAVIGMWSIIRYTKKPQYKWLVISGVCVALAFGFRQTAAVIAVPIAAAALFTLLYKKFGYKEIVLHGVVYVLAVLTPIFIVTAIFFFLNAFDDVMSQVFAYNAVYAQSKTGSVVSAFKFLLSSNLAKYPYLLTLSLFGILSGIILSIQTRRDNSNPSYVRMYFVLALLWFLIDLWAISISGRYYEHYFFQLIPSLAVLAGFFMYLLPIRSIAVTSTVVLIVAALAWLYSPFGTDIANQQDFWRKYQKAQTEEDRYILAYESQKGKVITWMRQLPEHDQVLFWGAEAELYVEGGHEYRLKHSFMYPLHARDYVTPEMTDGFLSSLANRPPQYIVDASGTDSSIASIRDGKIRNTNLISSEETVKPVIDFIQTNYSVYDTIERWTIYKRNTEI